MPTARTPWRIPIGDTWTKTLIYYSRYTAPQLRKDLTGYTARAQFRQRASSPSALADLSTENGGVVLGGTQGTIQLELDTTGMSPCDAEFDLVLIDPSGAERTRIEQPKAEFYQRVTRTS